MAHYFSDEYFNMIRLYFLNRENSARAAAEYARVYPNLRHPDANVINGAIRRLRETGNVIPQGADAGRPRRVRNVATEDLVLNMVDANRRTSTRTIGHELEFLTLRCIRF